MFQQAEIPPQALYAAHDDRLEARGDSSLQERPIAPQQEWIERGIGSGYQFVDDRNPVAERPKPHGLLPVPAELEAIVVKEKARLASEHSIIPTAEAIQRIVDSLCLQYDFDGIDVAYRQSPHGVEVLAVGLEEVGRFIENTTPDQREGVVIGQG
jgi:hypothetical protein